MKRIRSAVIGIGAVLAIGGGFVAFGASPNAHAGGLSSPIPNLTECSAYSFRTVLTQSWSASPFNVTGNLQQGYDNNFGVWCPKYRYQVIVQASSYYQNGTLLVDVSSCGLKGNELSYSLPQGSYTNTYYSQVGTIYQPSASGWWQISDPSESISHYGSCGGN